MLATPGACEKTAHTEEAGRESYSVGESLLISGVTRREFHPRHRIDMATYFSTAVATLATLNDREDCPIRSHVIVVGMGIARSRKRVQKRAIGTSDHLCHRITSFLLGFFSKNSSRFSGLAT
jgi:hypothetical protein